MRSHPTESVLPFRFDLSEEIKMSEIFSPKSLKSQPFPKDAMTSSVNDNGNKTMFHHPVTSSNGGAPNAKNSGRGAATPNSAQKKKQGALALAGLFATGGDINGEEEVVVEAPVLDTITEVVTLSSSNSGSFETFDIRGSNNNLGEDLDAVNDKRKVDEISDELNDPLMNYVETECGIVPPAAHHHHQQQQQPQIIRAGSSVDTSPRKKSRLAIPVHGINALPDPRTADVALPTVVSTPQKVASILASQLPRTSVPPGVPMPQLPSVQQYHLPPSSGKTSFEQLMQVSVFFICRYWYP